MSSLVRIFGLVLALALVAACGILQTRPDDLDRGVWKLGVSDVDLPGGCSLIDIQIDIRQPRPPPGSEKNLLLRLGFTPALEETSFTNTPGIDFGAPLRIVVTVIQVFGDCPPFKAPEQWHFDGTLTREADGTLSADLTGFQLRFRRD